MRRLHRKSRTGCAQCKRRRVKCDERKPFCTSCERNQLQCSLEFLTPISSSSRAVQGTLHASRLTANRPSTGLSDSVFDTQTRELLNHYTSSVFISLAGNRRRSSVWRISVPQLGLAHPFLLSGIKAISALHLATLLPVRRQELQIVAVGQISTALRSFCASMMSPDVEMIHPNFGFIGSAVYYMMALPDSAGVNPNWKIDRCRIPSKGDHHPHWFEMMRGLMTFLAKNWHTLGKGPFAPLLEGDPDVNCPPADYAEDEHLAKLQKICHISSSTLGQDSQSPEQAEREVELCTEAVKILREATALAHPAHSHAGDLTLCDKTALYVWPGRISQDFVDLIYRREPRALVILAHYCVLLKKNDHVWCLTGVGSGLLDNIWHALSSEWRPWIQRLMEQPVS